MYDIENRAGKSIFQFLLTCKDSFESLENYTPSTAIIQKSINALIPKQWVIDYTNGIWCRISPPNPKKLLSRGFKIHLSCTSSDYQELLNRVIPILVAQELQFKCLIDTNIADVVNTQNFSRASSGKFITVYPYNDNCFTEIIEKLYQITTRFEGPYILSDRAYKDSKVVFYRYGSFKPFLILGINGQKQSYIQDNDNQWILEQRQPVFTLPKGVKDPFEQNLEKFTSVTLNNQYKIEGIIHISNKGGIYAAIDQNTNKKVIIKEARPLVNHTIDFPHDAVVTLENEYRCLTKLCVSEFTPKPIAFFKEWKHHFLVMEYLEGITLTKYIASIDFNLFLQDNPSDEDKIKYCSRFLRLGQALFQGLKRIHAHGVIIRDIAPQNVVIDIQSLQVKFIDFETAFIPGDPDSIVVPVGTIGFSSGSENEPSPEKDFQAFINLLTSVFLPNQHFFALNPDARESLISSMIEDHGLPDLFKAILFSKSESELEKGFQELTLFLNAPKFPSLKAPTSTLDLRGIGQKISNHILTTVNRAHPTRLFPCDYRIFTTNGLCLAYGALGIALYLQKVHGSLPQDLEQELVNRANKVNKDDFTPGLFLGSSGIAYALDQIGQKGLAIRLMEEAYASPLRGQNADLFHGDAGLGLASLYFYRQHGGQQHLDMAVTTAKNIEKLLKKSIQGHYFPNFTGDVYHGLAYGSAGIALFFLGLYNLTKVEKTKKLALSLMDFEISHAIDSGQGVRWPRSKKNQHTLMSYWATGGAGMGIALTRFYSVLGEDRFLSMAEKAAHRLKGKYCQAPGLFMGTAGLGQFFIELYRQTGSIQHLEEARFFAKKSLDYKIEKDQKIAFAGEDLLRICHDVGTGSAGIGLFLHQLQHLEEAPFAGLI